MKKESKDLLMAVIESHIDFLMTQLNGVYSTDYPEAKQYCEDLVHYFILLDTFFDSGTVNMDETPEKINDYCSTFDSWVFVKGYLTEYEEWKDDVHSIAVDKGLEDGEAEVIELLS